MQIMDRKHPLHLAAALNEKRVVSSSAIPIAARMAEVLLATQSVISHMPHYSSINDFGELFNMMFQDSEIESKKELGRIKNVGNKAKKANLQMEVTRKQSTLNFPKNEHFKCSFFGKFGLLCFLLSEVRPFALLTTKIGLYSKFWTSHIFSKGTFQCFTVRGVH